jgi:CelD/BcsL family acetyltransferase involved in cellulose biosynthesis
VPEGDRAERIDADGLRDPALLGAWRELAVLRENPFLSPEWFLSSTESSAEETPHALAWRVAGELRGVLPLVAVSRGPFKLLRFVNARRGDWFGPACRREDEEAMAVACAELLERESGSWNAVRLDRVDSESCWPQALDRSGAKVSLGPRRRQDVLPFIAFDERGFEGYMADRSRNFRSQLGRRRRRLERDHDLRFRMTETPAELEPDMDSFFRLHDERWEKRGGSTLGTAKSRVLHRRFAAATLELGWLRLWIAEADGEPAAAWYGWRVGGRYCYALAGLGDRFERDGLGSVLLAHTIEQAAAEGATIYDLMWGDEAYKHRFETGQRQVATWLLAGGAPSRAAISASVHTARALSSLPAGVREPLKRLQQTLRRS